MLLFSVLAVNSDWFQILQGFPLLLKPPVLTHFCFVLWWYLYSILSTYVHVLAVCIHSVWTLVLGREDHNGLRIPPPDHASATCRPLTHIKASSPLMDVGTLRTDSLQSGAVLIESWFNDNVIRSYKSCSFICIWFQLLHTCYCVRNIATEYSCNDMSIYNYIIIEHKCTSNKSA